ncbi:MAG TPA: hypothetical protein VMJ93_04835 [Verrucomicrobiae bacterium]|nr:hypothetical protein [Verrucomicrobiae bacterium]
MADSTLPSQIVAALAAAQAGVRERAARELFQMGRDSALRAIRGWTSDAEAGPLFARDSEGKLKVTVGVAVSPATFALIHSAAGAPPLACVPPDQDAKEFELHFPGGVSLDILTTQDPGGRGAIAKFLNKFGEGIQQVEFVVRDIDEITGILQAKLGAPPIYPATRAGADGTRVNFFLAPAAEGKKILVELVEEQA